MSTQYAYSTDEENYNGRCDSIEEAIAECRDENEDPVTVFVGEIVPPRPVEEIIDGDDVDQIFDWIREYEDYDHEWVDDWPRAKDEQKEELGKKIGSLIGQWLDENNLRPSFYTVKNVKEFPAEA